MSIVEYIAEPLGYHFMQQALLGLVLASINCGLIGSFIVLRRMSFIGEAMSHTILPGVVFAYIKGFSLFVGALLASLVTAAGVGFLSSRKEVREDSAIGVVLSGMFALGVVLMSSVHSFRDFGSILFGSVLAVRAGDLYLLAGVSCILCSLIFIFYKELELSSYDEDYSQMIGVRPKFLRMLILFLAALSVVSAVEMLGALLATAMIIIPASTAALVFYSLGRIIAASIGFAILGSVLGLYLSYYFQLASGASIVLTSFTLFLLVWGLKRFLGWRVRNLQSI